MRGLGLALVSFAVLLAAMALLHASQTALVACVIVAGTFLGVITTLMTQVVMESAPVQRPAASAAYSFVRFCGGAIAPYVAGKVGEHVSEAAPFWLGAGMAAIGVAVLWAYRDARGSAVRVVHVVETDVLAGEDAADLETASEGRDLLDACVAELAT